MAIKKVEKYTADETVQKKKKCKVSVDTQVIIIDDDENDCDGYSDLPKKAKVKKKKNFLKRKYSYQEGTKEKKKKKSDSDIKNKACANLPIIIESSSDSEVVMKHRKISKIHKKKVKRRLSCEGDGICEALRQFSKKKDPGSHGESAECIEKKKKKKHKATCSLMLQGEDHVVESQKQTIRNGEAISQDAASHGRKKRQTLVKNKAKKRKLLTLDNEGSKDSIPDKRNANAVYQLQGGNDCKRRVLGCKGHQDSAAQVSEEETRVIRKKRKKKKSQKEKVSFFAISAKNQENNCDVSNKNLLKPKLRKPQVFQEKKMKLILDTEGVGRVTKKKTIHTKVANNRTALLEEDALVVKEHKKKIKKCKDINEFTVTGNSARCENGGKQHIKKRKNMDRCNADNCEEEPSLKKRKLKKETKVREDEIKVVAFKKGNCDEINIDKSRRQALQEEIDQASGKTKAIQEEGEWESRFGQWSTAAFGSSERKDKFLRLLGGFKKSSSASVAQSPSAHAPKPNMAFDWKKEQSLQQDLQTEFEMAVNRKHHRNIGLGFQPAARKHMQIDKYASKSIKFED
nr:lysine-rich nucleolar protein 1 isoform X1 [Anolis sagrei ordinatus]XP_060642281.1 lysine-rich nucleolar protein 1 isoform X1 [Anolis sagrei ordinatus]XP_060642282.1 lysine-rich nucleolar protein 1 isoform X1 [Anolis sagrei ordinatus]